MWSSTPQEPWGESMARIAIDKLLDYWLEISKRQPLTLADYRQFFARAEFTMRYFAEFYGWVRLKHVQQSEKFFQTVHFLVWNKDNYLKAVKGNTLSNQEYVLVKNIAKKFIPRIRRCFGQGIVAATNTKTPVQDAETLLKLSSKLTHRWAAGIVASNHIANLLIKLSGPTKTDDIKTLYANMTNKTANQKLKKFLQTSYSRFDGADKTRNRCAHVNLGEPTKQEIEQSISLARLLQKYKVRSV